jgi:hypothetical protein
MFIILTEIARGADTIKVDPTVKRWNYPWAYPRKTETNTKDA